MFQFNFDYSSYINGFLLGAGGVIGSSEITLTRGIENECTRNVMMMFSSLYHGIIEVIEFLKFEGLAIDNVTHFVLGFSHFYDFLLALFSIDCNIRFDDIYEFFESTLFPE